MEITQHMFNANELKQTIWSWTSAFWLSPIVEGWIHSSIEIKISNVNETSGSSLRQRYSGFNYYWGFLTEFFLLSAFAATK